MPTGTKLFHLYNKKGRLTLVAAIPPRRPGGSPRMWAHCDCGGERMVSHRAWVDEGNLHCGCSHGPEKWTSIKTHGASKTREYAIFRSMWQRCTNPKNDAWADYGGRGIHVDPAWRKFDAFIAHVGPRPGPQWSLDRIDCNGPYAPGNVRWAIKSDQANNRRNTRYLTAHGKTQPMSHWALELGLTYACLEGRLKNSPPEIALVREGYRRPNLPRRVRRTLTHGGKTQSITAWAEELGISRHLISKRLGKGYTTAEALHNGNYYNYWRLRGDQPTPARPAPDQKPPSRRRRP